MSIITANDVLAEIEAMNEPGYTVLATTNIDGGYVVTVNGGYIIVDDWGPTGIEAYENSGIDDWCEANDVDFCCVHLVNGWEEADRLLDRWTTDKSLREFFA